MSQTNINYKFLLDYISKYGGVKYEGESDQRKSELRTQGNLALVEMKKISNVLINNQLREGRPSTYLKMFQTCMRTYLWNKFLYKPKSQKVFTLSFFCEKDNEGKSRFRISIQLDQKKAKLGDETFILSLLKMDSSLVSGAYFTNAGHTVGHYTKEQIQEIANNKNVDELNKIEFCYAIYENQNFSNDDYESKIKEIFNKFIPIYVNIFENKSEYKTLDLDQKERNKEMQNIDSKFKLPYLNTIFFGPAGTGKTYYTKKFASQICGMKNLNNESEITNLYNNFLSNGQIEFVTFHQSFDYEDFVEGYKPCLSNADGMNTIQYEIKPGVFKKISKKAIENPEKNFVLIIDEINRGNIAKIFGELITLIEPSKRMGKSDEIKLILPYSKEFFFVPQNLFIVGTMNTSDRSIALIDFALRRRFEFKEMLPDSTILSDINIEGIQLDKLLLSINKRLEFLIDKEHTIGHAYFMNLNNNSTVKDLGDVFKNKIVPLLQEYFYDDYYKIQLVLNDVEKNKFIKPESLNSYEGLFKFNNKIEDVDIDSFKAFSYNIEFDKSVFEDPKIYIDMYSQIKLNKDE